MTHRLSIVPILCFVLVAGCATKVTQRQGVQAAVAVHAVIAAVDDTEMTLFKGNVITAEQHAKANPIVLRALKAGQSFDASVRIWPADGELTKQNLKGVTDALAELAKVVAEFGSPEAKQRMLLGIASAQQAVLAVLALLL